MITITEETLDLLYLYLPMCALGVGLLLNLLALASLLRSIGCKPSTAWCWYCCMCRSERRRRANSGIGAGDRSEPTAATTSSSSLSSSGESVHLVPRTHYLLVALLANDVLVLLTRPALHLLTLALISMFFSTATSSSSTISNEAARARFVLLDWSVCRVGLFLQQCVASFSGWLPVLVIATHVFSGARSEEAYLRLVDPTYHSGQTHRRRRAISFRSDVRQMLKHTAERSLLCVKIVVFAAASLISLLHVHTLWIYRMDTSHAECSVFFAHHNFFRKFWIPLLYLLDSPLPLGFFYISILAAAVNCVYECVFAGFRVRTQPPNSNPEISEQQLAFYEAHRLVRATSALHLMVYTPFVVSELLLNKSDDDPMSPESAEADATRAFLGEFLEAAVVLHHAIILPLSVLFTARSLRAALAKDLHSALNWCSEHLTLEPYSDHVGGHAGRQHTSETAITELRHEPEAQLVTRPRGAGAPNNASPAAAGTRAQVAAGSRAQVVIELETHTRTAATPLSRHASANSSRKSRKLRSYSQFDFIDEPETHV